MKLTFLELDRIFEPTLDRASQQVLIEFTIRVKHGGHPLCLTCDTTWPDLKCEPPAAVAIVTPHEFFCADPHAEKPAIVSGVCQDCWHSGNILERAKAVFRATLWPDLRDVAEPIKQTQ